MPAALRGAGRSSAKARSKSSASPQKGRSAPVKPGGAARSAMSVPPRLVFALAGVALVGVVAVALATDHRGARLVASAGDAALQGAAEARFRLENVRLAGG